MEIVHYIHFNKLWYYWIDDKNQKKYFRKLRTEQDFNNVTLLSKETLTEREVRVLLQKRFPTSKIMKALNYHFSPSNFGSRPIKKTIDRKKMIKEKINFKKELENL